MMARAEITEAIEWAAAPYADATSATEALRSRASQVPEDGYGTGPLRILSAACDRFYKVGFHGTSTRDIATAAGMSATALYAHYPSKQAMLAKLCILGTASALEALRKGGDPALPPVQRLRSAVYSFACWHANNYIIGRVAQWDLSALEPSSFEVVASLRRDIDRELRATLTEGVTTREFAIHDLTGTTLAILSLCIDIVRWFPSRRIRVAEDIASTYVGLVESMVLSGAAREQTPRSVIGRP